MAETDCGSQYYAKLTAYAGQRLNDNMLKQTAWDVLNKNTTGIWPPVTKLVEQMLSTQSTRYVTRSVPLYTT